MRFLWPHAFLGQHLMQEHVFKISRWHSRWMHMRNIFFVVINGGAHVQDPEFLYLYLWLFTIHTTLFHPQPKTSAWAFSLPIRIPLSIWPTSTGLTPALRERLYQ